MLRCPNGDFVLSDKSRADLWKHRPSGIHRRI